MFGIADYNPKFFYDVNSITCLLGNQLSQLIGKAISEIWVVWDIGDNEWVRGCPVVLKIDNDNLELCATKLQGFSITWNTINLVNKPDRNIRDFMSFDLEWRKLSTKETQLILNKRITNTHFIEYSFITTTIDNKHFLDRIRRKKASWLLHGIGFTFENGYIAICNGFDENEIVFEPQVSERFRNTNIIVAK